MTRRLGSAVFLAAAMVATSNVPPAVAADQQLPDLGMAPLSNISLEEVDGRLLLRYSTVIVNVGAGPFELAAQRQAPGESFTAAQLLTGSDGSTSEVEVPARFVFGGDGHDHWHVQDLGSYRLERLDDGEDVGAGRKFGFCFFDTTPYRLSLPGAPREPQFDDGGCGETSSTNLSMGVSVGWGDLYSARLPDQFIDITGLPDGGYRLRATADAFETFAESDRTNNETWVDFSLSHGDDDGGGGDDGPRLRVLDRGPAA